MKTDFVSLVLDLALSACAVGIMVGTIASAVAVVRGLGTRAELVSPVEHRRQRLSKKPKPGEHAPDIAWPWYFRRQAREDLRQVATEFGGIAATFWRWPARTFLTVRNPAQLIWWLVFPLPIAAFSFLLGATLILLLGFLLVLVVTAACAAVAVVFFALAVALLRTVDWTLARIRRTAASCPHCYYVSVRPAYQCPGCESLHRDVRPGSLGIFVRRCDCGVLLPTTVRRAAWRLTAVCQRCEKPLRQGAAAVRDVRVPIFGDASAGKTRFLYSALDSLMDTSARTNLDVSFPDEESHARAEHALDLIRSGREIAKTSEELPRAFSLRLGEGPSGTLVHLFDAAGERYRDAASHDDLGFLENGHGLIYVLDPFAIGAVRDRLTGHAEAALRLAHAATRDPQAAYDEVVSRLRGSGVAAKSQQLAVVVSKVDVLSDCGFDYPTTDSEIAIWLSDAGLHNMVTAARMEFGSVKYFAVASLSAAETTVATDPGSPLRWLLRAHGVRLPAEPAQLAVGEDRA